MLFVSFHELRHLTAYLSEGVKDVIELWFVEPQLISRGSRSVQTSQTHRTLDDIIYLVIKLKEEVS